MLPIWWQRQESNPLLTRTVGTDALATLFYVQEDGVLEFTPMIPVSHFPLTHHGTTTLSITLQALALEADSEPVRVKLDWDGVWHDGETEMKNHCIVSLDPPSGS